MHDEVEEWRPVVGWEGQYDVSSLGRVRRTVGSKRWGTILRFSYVKGYARCRLFRRPGITSVVVHRLVAEAFIGPRPDGHEVNHKDGARANNRPDNLEYVTPAGNTAHAVTVLGRPNGRPGTQNGRATLTEEDVQKAISMLAAGQPKKAVAAHFGKHWSWAYGLSHGRIWRHLTPQSS